MPGIKPGEGKKDSEKRRVERDTDSQNKGWKGENAEKTLHNSRGRERHAVEGGSEGVWEGVLDDQRAPESGREQTRLHLKDREGRESTFMEECDNAQFM